MAERKVLLCIDGSDIADHAFKFYLNELYRENDFLVLLHCSPPPKLSAFSTSDPMHLPTKEWMDELTENNKKANLLIEKYECECEGKKIHKKSVINHHKPGEAIIEEANKESVALIVMGSRGLNTLRRTFVGSVSDYVLHHTHIPVVVVPPPTA